MRSRPRFRWHACSSALAVFLAAGVVAPAADASERIVYRASDGFIWSANDDGSALTRVADCYCTNPALSPTGDLVVYDEGYTEIWLRDADGSNPTRIYGGSGQPQGYNPKFTPSGRAIVFTRESSATGDDIYIVNRDGTNLHPLVERPGHQDGVSVSADGTRIAFHSSEGGGGYRIYTARGDGTDLRLLDVRGMTGSIFDPHLSPGGDEIAFDAVPAGESDYEVFVIRADGTGLRRLTNNTWRDMNPEWSPDGGWLVYDSNPAGNDDVYRMSSLDGSNRTAVIAGPAGDFGASYRQASATIDAYDDIAFNLRPILRFDDDEQWRPLNVNRFFAERNDAGQSLHQVCDRAVPASCRLVSSPDDLRAFNSETAYLDVAGTGLDGADYHSPYARCTSASLRDCDSGLDGALYYHSVPGSPGGYTYIDYWWFYRWNDAPNLEGNVLADLDHEGDWEGISVAPSPTNPNTFDFASFSQHGHSYNYLRENLRCDAGADGSCGSESARSGQRVWTSVATGTHASYPVDCETGPVLGFPPATYCRSGNTMTPESNHNGEDAWGNNDFAGALIELPAAGGWDPTQPKNWTDWPGRWGLQGSVASPARQERYSSPWAAACANDNDGCARDDGIAASGAEAATGSRAASAPSCASWFGGFVSVTACDQASLKRAVATAALGREGPFAVSARGDVGPSAPGVSQLLGSPLRVGDELSIDGRLPEAGKIFVRVLHRKRVLAAEFRPGTALNGSESAFRIRSDVAGSSVELELPSGERLIPTRVRSMRADR